MDEKDRQTNIHTTHIDLGETFACLFVCFASRHPNGPKLGVFDTEESISDSEQES